MAEFCPAKEGSTPATFFQSAMAKQWKGHLRLALEVVVEDILLTLVPLLLESILPNSSHRIYYAVGHRVNGGLPCLT